MDERSNQHHCNRLGVIMSVVQTYYLTIALINFVLAFAAIRIKGVEERLESVWFLSGSFFSFGLSWFLYSLELTPLIEVSSTILSTVFIWGITVFSYKRCKIKTPWLLIIFLFTSNITIQTVFTLSENITYVLHTATIFIPIAFSLCGYLFLKRKVNRTPSDTVIAYFFFALAIIVVIRSILLETSPALFSMTSASTQIIWPVFSVALGILSLQSFTEEAQQKLIVKSMTDELTGVYNRRMFDKHFQQLLEKLSINKQYGALIYLDLNGFKSINDQYGHTIGDAILREIGKRLHHSIMKKEMVFRVGGDEFTILQNYAGNDAPQAHQNAFELAQKAQNCIGLPIDAHGIKATISCSIGVHILVPGATNIPFETGAADAAMYKAKKSKVAKIMFSGFSNRPRYSVKKVGIAEIDEEHQHIDYYINALLDKKISFHHGLPELISLISNHFRNEVLVAERLGLKIRNSHKSDHQKILKLLKQFDANAEKSVLMDNLATIEHILVQHIENYDTYLKTNVADIDESSYVINTVND
jgi:diguanylate cyclase (GGDEF)-like protein